MTDRIQGSLLCHEGHDIVSWTELHCLLDKWDDSCGCISVSVGKVSMLGSKTMSHRVIVSLVCRISITTDDVSQTASILRLLILNMLGAFNHGSNATVPQTLCPLNSRHLGDVARMAYLSLFEITVDARNNTSSPMSHRRQHCIIPM